MSNKALSSLTMHELQHYASRNLKSKFYNLNKDTFRTYFRNFYKIHFDVNLPDSVIDDFVIFVLKNFEYPSKQSTQFLVRFANVMFDEMADYIPDQTKREDSVRSVMATLKVYLTNPNAFVSAIQSGHPEMTKVIRSLTAAYRSLKIKNPRSLTIQELIFPSEVICIESQHKTNNNHYAAIKAL